MCRAVEGRGQRVDSSAGRPRVRTELSVAPTAMMPEAEATDGKSLRATVWACVDWYDVGRP